MIKKFHDPKRNPDIFLQKALQEAEHNEAEVLVVKPQTVAELTCKIKSLLENQIQRIYVTGEISNLSQPRSGHIYFTLKDAHAAINCVIWRSTASRLELDLKDGIQVELRGKITVYEPQGRYQIIADSLRKAGVGNLQQQFELLKEKLRNEGLFAPEHKQELPAYPKRIGIVTSATGAALRDIIRILRRRLPGIRIILSPSPVQGEGAAAAIAQALKLIDLAKLCDVIIVGRGGGSLEDLWAFNEEIVAKAIFTATTPVVSAVGHETDFTIADMVADYRAATPSEAAETVVPEAIEVEAMLTKLRLQMTRELTAYLEFSRIKLTNLASRPVLRDPSTIIMLKSQKIDNLLQKLHEIAWNLIKKHQSSLSVLAAKLQTLSPLKVMARGYSVSYNYSKRKLVHKASEVTIGDKLETRLCQGTVWSEVIKIETE